MRFAFIISVFLATVGCSPRSTSGSASAFNTDVSPTSPAVESSEPPSPSVPSPAPTSTFSTANTAGGLRFAPSTFGRYVGILEHTQTNMDQVAKLDFIWSHEEGASISLKAVLSLYFGDFSNTEYVSYHFNSVKYSLLTGELVFDQADQDVTIKSLSFGSGTLTATVWSAVAGQVGTLTLKVDGTADPRRSLVLPVEGEYTGHCEGKPADLHLRTFRTTSDTVRAGEPFSAYAIRGDFGDQSTYGCDGSASERCVIDVIVGGSYDFYRAHLTLVGERNHYSCTVTSGDLDCGTCRLNRVTRGPVPIAVSSPIVSENRAIEDTAKSGPEAIRGSIAGDYYGYVHHERLDLYQPAHLSLVTYQDQGSQTGTLKMSAVARIFFGDYSSSEILTYRFEPRSFNLLSPVFLFERMADDVDAVLQIVSFDGETVRGVWFSIQFGRVGTFELKKSVIPPPPSGATMFRSLAGGYTFENVSLHAFTRVASTPVNTLNPYFPINFGGYFEMKSGLAPIVSIVGGSYDFYTGKIGFETESNAQPIIGSFDNRSGNLHLKKPASGVGMLQQPYPSDEYRRFYP